jgi:predicted ribosomally synthesized peptide with SipW-like signal peptide
MKSIFLSLLVVSALVAAGIGGTLADFSDSEEEMGDVLQAGSLDLKVNDADDPDVMPFAITTIIPDKPYDVAKSVKNVGTIDGYLYLHIKNVVCNETNDKDLDGDGAIEDGPGVMDDKPEPEKVAEFGGKVGQQTVVGLGERCDMEKHIYTEIWFGTDPTDPTTMTEIDLSQYDKNGDGEIKLDELMCEQILITPQGSPLPACGDEYFVNFIFLLQDVKDPNWPGDPKFAHWPTNCYMGDTVTFDILFELLQSDYTPPGGPPP